MSAVVSVLASASAADRPLAFFLDGREYTVTRLLARDRTPEALVFTVATRPAGLYRLIFDLQTAEWQISPLEEAE